MGQKYNDGQNVMKARVNIMMCALAGCGSLCTLEGLSTRVWRLYSWGYCYFVFFHITVTRIVSLSDLALAVHTLYVAAWVTNPVTFQHLSLQLVVVQTVSDPPCVGPDDS